jgi:hypothetical protein
MRPREKRQGDAISLLRLLGAKLANGLFHCGKSLNNISVTYFLKTAVFLFPPH